MSRLTRPATRVIHIRIDDKTLLACLEYYDKFSPPDTRNEAISTRIVAVLRSFMRTMREDHFIITHEPEHVADALSVLLGQRDDALVEAPKFKPSMKATDIITPEPVIAPSNPDNQDTMPLPLELLQELADADDPMAAMKDGIDAALAAIATPDIELDPEAFAPDPDDLHDPGENVLDIESVPQYTFDELLALAPNNSFLREAVLNRDESEFYGIMIGFKHVSCANWRNSKAREMIKGMKTHYNRYKKAGGLFGDITEADWDEMQDKIPGGKIVKEQKDEDDEG